MSYPQSSNTGSGARGFFKTFFAALLALFVGGAIVVGLLLAIGIKLGSSEKSEQDAKLRKSPILSIDLSKGFHEVGAENSDRYAVLIAGKDYSPGLYDALEAIKAAATDKNIKAVYLRLDGSPDGWATAQQLREALATFKKSGKKIYAYGENISQKDYYIGSVANTVSLHPTGMLWFKGLASQLTFFKGSLDRLGVQPEIFYAGRFKSFTEPYRAEKMSEPNRRQLAAIQSGVWQQMLRAVSEKTGADTATVNGWAQRGAIQFPEQAVQYKLVDTLQYRDELEAQIRREQDLKVDSSEEEPLPLVSLTQYAEHVSDKAANEKDRIALLFAEGAITDGKGPDYTIASEDFVKQLRRIRANDKIKALVVRINSGGGSALASEVILRELSLVRQKMPVIVSMGDVAASGGYYMACGADSIFALPNTITGSIGVFAMLFNTGDAARDKLGVTFDVEKNAPYADFPTISRSLTTDEAGRMQATIDTIYQTFMRRVAAGRKMQVWQVDSIAQGRVWTGTDALRIGLIDGLGGLDRAIQSAAAKAGLKKYSVKTYPEPVQALAQQLRQFTGGPFGEAAVNEAMETVVGPEWQALQHLRYLRQTSGRAQAVMPFQVVTE